MKRLRYEISNWDQAEQCLSNNSKELYITVSDFIQNCSIEGKLLSVHHSVYGQLFSTLVEGKGRIISETDESGYPLLWLDTTTILSQLEKFGFDITYQEEVCLPGDVLSYLMTMKSLGFDKITRLSVRDSEGVRPTAVAFRSTAHPLWMTFGLAVQSRSLADATMNGSACNMSKASGLGESAWRWMSYTANIDDILAANVDATDPDIDDNPIHNVIKKPKDSMVTSTDLEPQGFHVYSDEGSDE